MPAVASKSVEARVDLCVFVNCPFDDGYLHLLHAMLFAIHDCGYVARIALEDTGSNETRIDKIVRIIRESRLSIHDISRVELSEPSKLPRFNMPFECGLAMGAIRFGAWALERDFLLLSAEAYQDKRTLSDLAGQDPKYHSGDPERLVAALRTFLSAKRPKGSRTRGAAAIWTRYQRFTGDLPVLSSSLEISIDEIRSFDYLSDWLAIMSAWLLQRH
jgi:hypothetical protein